MCLGPTTMTVLQVVAGLVGVVGAQQTARAQAAQHEAVAARYDAEAKQAEMRAHEEVLAAGAEEEKLKRRLAIIKGEQRAAYGASGFSAQSGSALSAVLDTELEGMKDVASLRYNAQVRRADLINEGAFTRHAAATERMSASSARSAGNIGALSSLIGTATSVASGWYQMGGLSPKPAAPSATAWNASPLTYNNTGYRSLFHRGR